MDCGEDFVFTAGEQIFFHDKQFKNLPKRCKTCKQKRSPAKGAPNQFNKQETVAVCSGCGKETTLPFRPTQAGQCFVVSVSGSRRKQPEHTPEISVARTAVVQCGRANPGGVRWLSGLLLP